MSPTGHRPLAPPAYREHHLTRAGHCDAARPYRDVSGAMVWRCRHDLTDPGRAALAATARPAPETP